ncbi:hypothetical protein, partial [Helicobacter pylori]|uniref:hypothetical protein n=1 Tax=Helicobacter pylori TaxID=210 RepID=UPI001EE89CE7
LCLCERLIVNDVMFDALLLCFLFLQTKPGIELSFSLVGSEMCIRESSFKKAFKSKRGKVCGHL